MKRFLIGFMLLASVAYAAPTTTLVTPNNFTPNTTIQSSQMNANFNEIQTQYNNHSHNDITSVGAITNGSWLGTPVGTSYGGTGQNFGSVAQGSIIYFNGSGTMTTLAPGSANQVLQTNGTTPSWVSGGTATDGFSRGLEINYTTGTSITASAGVVYVGNTQVNSATSFVATLTNAWAWASGSVVSYAGGSGWCYVGVNELGEISLLGTLTPNSTDTAGNTEGTKYYRNYLGHYWRYLGAFRVNTLDNIEQGWSQDGNLITWDRPVTVTSVVSGGAWSGAISCSAGMPAISTRAIFHTWNASAAGETGGVAIRSYSQPSFGTTEEKIGGYGSQIAQNFGGFIDSRTDLSQQISHWDSATNGVEINVVSYYLNIR